MSRIKWADIRDASFPNAGSPRAIISSGSGKLDAFGDAVPEDGIAGYAKGCTFKDVTDGKVYVNKGSSTSCSFQELLSGASASGTAAGRGPSPLIWDGCPVLNFIMDPTQGWVYFNDFITNGVVLAANQTVTRLGDGVLACTAATAGTVITTEADAREGEVKLETTTDNEDCIISMLGGVHTSGHVTFEAGKQTWFEARVKNLNITDAKFGVFCGFAEEGLVATTTLIAAAGTMANKDYIGFHSLEADGDTFDTVYNTAAGGGSTLKGDAVTIAADTYTKLGMYCDGSIIRFYANGVELADTLALATANVPNGEELAFYFGIMSAHGDLCSASIDWVRVAQEH